MMTRTITTLVAAIALPLLGGMATAQTLTKEQLPKAVVAAFGKAYPSATLNASSREKRGGKTCYELETMDGSQARDIIYAADGSVIEIEEGIAPASLPSVVSQALNKRFPNIPVEKAEKLIRGSVIEYEAILSIGNQKKEVILSEQGVILKVKKA